MTGLGAVWLAGPEPRIVEGLINLGWDLLTYLLKSSVAFAALVLVVLQVATNRRQNGVQLWGLTGGTVASWVVGAWSFFALGGMAQAWLFCRELR
jgi:hypothetical protein